MKRIIAMTAIIVAVGCAKKTPPAQVQQEPLQPPVAYVPPTTQPAAPVVTDVTPLPPEPAPAPAVTTHKHKAQVAQTPSGRKAKHAAATGTITGKKYTVKAGDTLSEISKRRYGTTKKVKAILRANPGLKADKVKVGQVINLP